MRTNCLVPFLSLLIASPVLGQIDLWNYSNYANQPVPDYIEIPPGMLPVTDAGATLGRVLFYDKNLSSNNTVSCASCHHQSLAFGDDGIASVGVNGVTGRHSMRLVNARFGRLSRFFWDRRADDLPDQATMPIRDHIEMGFSGESGAPDFNDLIVKLTAIPYYQVLFTDVFGDPAITEERIQTALAEFVGSIQSFDSKFDEGRSGANVNSAEDPFPNFSDDENDGKALFFEDFDFNNNATFMGTPVSARTTGGLNCATCHPMPLFDINNRNNKNNGNTRIIGSTGLDFTVSRSPSLRDFFDSNGNLNGGSFHTGDIANGFEEITSHYNFPSTSAATPNLDERLLKDGRVQHLEITPDEVLKLKAFMKTLAGINIYTDEKWSDPFNSDVLLTLYIYPASFNVVTGLVQGNVSALTQSDNVDLTIQRNPLSTQSVVVIDVESTSHTSSPAAFKFVHEGAAFARDPISQTFEIFDFTTSDWEVIGSDVASQFVDETSEFEATGDLSRFVEPGTLRVKSRVSYRAAERRAQFSIKIDLMRWEIK